MIRRGISYLLVLFLFRVHCDGLRQTLRREVILRQRNRCGLCHCEFSMMCPHEIHHLNRNPKDNNSSNLLALCANCHAAHHRFGVAVMPFFEQRNTTHYDSWEDSGMEKAYYE